MTRAPIAAQATLLPGQSSLDSWTELPSKPSKSASHPKIALRSPKARILRGALVFDFAVLRHLPAIYEFDALVRDGGLMSYGPDRAETFERTAAIVGRILRGSKPADLPFELPTRFKFALNLKTAKSIGLEVPPSLLARADEVIE
jgi:putative tryptophan/tyrosine transport system substrate-binding protein